MAAITKPYSGIPYLSNARSTLALEQIKARAEAKGDDIVAREAQVGLRDNAAWRVAIDGWIAQNRSAARQGGATYAIDAEADFVIGRIYAILDSLAKRRAGTPAGDAAATLVLDHFTDARGKAGMGVMAQVVYEEQLPRMRRFITTVDGTPGLGRLVRITDWLDDLRDIEPRYAASLEATDVVTWGEVLARRNTAYDSLFAVVGLISALHRHDPALLAWYLTPLDDQVARAADLARRRRAGQSMAVNEEELSAEELAELEGVAADADGDGVPDAAEVAPPADVAPPAVADLAAPAADLPGVAADDGRAEGPAGGGSSEVGDRGGESPVG